MEFLKKTFIACLLLGCFNAQPLFSQEMTVISAFKASYEKEKAGEYSKAIEALKAVYQEDAYEINLRLGWLCYQSGRFTESMAYYNKAVSIFPYAIEPKFGLVYPAAAVGKWDVVVKQYNDILSIDPNNTLASYRMGLVHYGREEYDQAEKYFKKIVNLYPFDYDGLLMLAWTNLKQQKNREAKLLFNKVLMYSPTDSSAIEGLGLIK